MKKCMKRKIFLFFACSVFIAAVLTAIIAPLCYAQAGTERDGKEVNEYEISVIVAIISGVQVYMTKRQEVEA